MDDLDGFVEVVLLLPKTEGNRWLKRAHMEGRQAQIIAMQISMKDQIVGMTLFPEIQLADIQIGAKFAGRIGNSLLGRNYKFGQCYFESL